jgi:hypothetical protein
MICKPPGDMPERDLTWLLASAPTGLSPDGGTVIFVDPLSAPAASEKTLIFRRTTDGAPAVPIGEGAAGALSPDGKWVVASSEENLILLPTGAGGTVALPKGSVVRFGAGKWLGDSKRIVFTGDPGDNKPRVYIQEIPAGIPRQMTPEGVVLAGRGAVRDDTSVLGRVGGSWRLFAISGGDGRAVPALKPGDLPVQWSRDGRYVYTVDATEAARPAAVDVFRVELTTGDRVLWKTLAPSDPVGVEDVRRNVVITPDAQAYCYSYQRRLGDLYVVDGLK